MKNRMLKMLKIKKWMLYMFITICLAVSVSAAVILIKPWEDNRGPANIHNNNTEQINKDDKGDEGNKNNEANNNNEGNKDSKDNNSNPLNNLVSSGNASNSNDLKQLDNVGESNNADTPDNSIPLSTLTFTIRFESNGGVPIEDKLLRGGTKLNDLPIPFKSGTIFMGWYYDQAFGRRVSHNDEIKSDITLYAKYAEAASLSEIETPRFATRLDQATNFSFKVFSPGGMSADQVKDALIAKNITNPKQTDFIEVTGSDGLFTISGKGGKFEAGATYKFSLDNESLNYEGFGESVRDYNFTTAKEEVLNLGLNDSIIYIDAEDVSNMTLDGEGVTSLSIPLATTDLGTIDYKSGTFTYDKEKLAIGSNVAIYKGLRPDLRGLGNDSSEGEVAYVTITEINGTTYKYKNADAEDILFTPDVLPINKSADIDGDQNNHSVTLAKSIMDFSNGTYSSLGLDEKTRVDIGDYIAFYSGEFGSPSGSASYSRITAVLLEGESMIISYVDATMDEIIASMDVYDTEGVDGEALLEGVDKETIENGIEQQASTSGFAQEAAKYLAALTLETDAFTQMDGDFDLESYNIVLSDGTPLTKDQIQLMDGKKVEVELTELKATIGTNLKHFEGLSGLRCTLKVVVEIKISTGEESEIVIAITGYFEQEVRIATNCSGAAIWKWWGIFPYIDEYQLNATIDLYDYTGISIEATIATKEKSEEWEFDTSDMGQSIAKQLKELIDAQEKYVGDGEDTVTDGLCDKYAAMLENESDWVELFSQDIFSKSGNIGPFGVIAYEIEFKFIVTANMNITIGCDFYYENAKRYNYSIGVFGKTCTNETIDLVEEHYEFTFYVMGTMGIRAGVKFEFKVGVFSTKLASVGISAEVGAYVRVWGYFYYELSYTASTGKHSKWSGALLFELGIYLEIKFEAQAFMGTFSYNPTLYENEWPLWSAGSRENVQAFAELEDDDPEIGLKKHLRTAVVPDDYFKMSYLDLKTGEVDEKSYDDEKCFDIEITNRAFTYDTATNIMKMIPDGDQVEVGQMVITWINAPLAFTSEPIQRTIDLYWDNYNDGYAIVFNSNGGSAVATIMKRFNAEITPPENPSKMGYDFGGWYSDSAFKQLYSIPATMPDSDMEVFAKWNPRNDTKYTVEHYHQNLNNNLYTLVDTDNLQGRTDSKVNPATKSYEGFATPSLNELMILPDGSAVQKYYYSRNSYVVTFEQNIENGQSDWIYNLKYGARIIVPNLSAIGYEFTGWNSLVVEAMPAKSLVYTAQWAAGKDTPYLVEHYIQNTNEDSYTLQTAQYRSGETNTLLTLENLKIKADGITYQQGSVKGKLTQTTAISKDGKLVVKLYYLRNTYTVNTQVENGVNTSTTYRYEALIGEPEIPSRVGYTFSGWYKDTLRTTPFIFANATIPASDLIIYGKLTPRVDTAYQVEHYVEQINGSFTLQNTDKLVGTTDTTVIFTELVKKDLLVTDGISYMEGKVGEVVVSSTRISGDEKLVIKLYYQRESHSLTFKQNNGKEDLVSLVKYGAPVTSPTGLMKTGYNFGGWDSTPVVIMSNTDMTYNAQWVSKTDTPYVVKHIRQLLDETYPDSGALVETENKTGTTDADTAAVSKQYEGFTPTTFVQTKIGAEGSTVVEIRYSRNSNTVTWKTDDTIYLSRNYKYGETITSPVVNPLKTGYNFYAWNGFGEGAIMPARDLTYSAQWTAATNTAYTVKHLVEELDGSYIVESTETRYGTTNAETTAVAKSYTGFTAGKVTQSTILADGSAVIEITYSRNSYSITWMTEGDTFKTESLKYKESIIVPATNPIKFGYNFKGWGVVVLTMPANNLSYDAIWEGEKHVVTFVFNDGTENSVAISQTYDSNYGLPKNAPIRAGYELNGWYTTDFGGTKVDENTMMKTNSTHRIYAQWKANTNTKYTVKHYQQNIIDNKYTLAFADTQSLMGVTDSITNAAAKNYIGFTVQSFSQQVINGDESSVVEIYYNRNSYTLTFIQGNGSENVISTIPFGAKITVPVSPQKTGYIFGGWGTVASTMPTSDLTYTAQWIAATDTAYTVKHLKEELDGSYIVESSQIQYGTTNADTAAAFKLYTGFTVGPVIQSKISADGSTVVEIRYSRNSYTVTWMNDGDAFKSEILKYKESIIVPGTNPTKIGYDFKGWGMIDPAMPANNVSYNAIWEGKKHVVTFAYNDGTQNSVEILQTYGNNYILPEYSPVRDGYALNGWYTIPLGGSLIDGNTIMKINLAHKLYAQWVVGTNTKYIVKHYQQNLENNEYTHILADQQSLTGVTDENTKAVAKSYSGFTAQSFAQLLINGDGSTVIEIYYNRNSYTLTFNPDNGSENIVSTVAYNEIITTPESPEKIGYTFDGWGIVASTMPASDLTYSAQWIAATNTAYTVKHLHEELDGSYTLESTETKYGTTNEGTSAVAKTYTGFTVGTVTQSVILADGSTVVEIRYTRNSYTITWKSDSDIFELVNLKYNELMIAPQTNPTKFGYDFKGWGVIPMTMPANNVSYDAIWEGKKQVVTFAYNDGTENSEEIIQTYGNNYILPETDPIRAGYTLKGWYTAPLDGTLVDKDTMMNSDLAHNIYAQWIVNTNTKYTVKTYHQNIEKNNYTQILEDTQLLTGVTDSNTNAVAKIYSGFTVQSFSQSVINGDGSTVVEIYYNRNSYSLTFKPDNGSENIVSTVAYGATITALTSPEKTGYTFDGWGSVAITMPANNVSYTAIWTANTHTVTFDVNGGEALSNLSKNVTYDNTYGELPVPTRTGYTFGGWYTTKTGGTNIVANTTVTITENQTIYANWTANTYTVNFDVAGGEVLEKTSKTVVYESTYGAMEVPSRMGYTFVGWYTAVSGGKIILETDQVSIIADQRLYARWTANEYTIIFNGNHATSGSMDNQAMTYDTSEDLNSNTFARIGYAFAGWAITPEGSVVYTDGISVLNLTATSNGTVTLFAQWTMEEYSISFQSNGGNSVETITRKHYNDTLSPPIAPIRSGYEFAGWYTDSSLETLYLFDFMPSYSFQLYARWNALNYTIDYELNGGTNHVNNTNIYTIESASITLGNPTRNDYIFEGWYTEGTFVNKVEGIAIANKTTGEKTFYAKWTAVVYTIDYGNLGGAENTNSTTYTVESEIILVAPSNRTGYTFGGWYDNASYNGAVVNAIQIGSSGNKSFYAKWNTSSYNINYVLNNGTNDDGNLLFYNVESSSITLTNPTRIAYNFDGWYTDSSFANKVSGIAINTGSTGVKTFYAKWTPVNYTIQYQLNGGTGGNQNPNSYTVESSITLEAPTRSGYTFAGWFDNSSFTGTSVGTISSGSTGNKTFYGKWTLITYTVTYNLNGGTNGANLSTYTVESQTIALQNPTKGVDDVFAGWYSNNSFTGLAMTHITSGSTGNVTLYAKWINYGSFNLVNNGNNTFTITRSGGSDGIQTVNYRTQNGSALGGSHFNHVNSSVTFAQGETTKTITITENSVTFSYNGMTTTAYSNADRVYFLDIYSVDGGGKLGGTTRATRTMAKNSNYTIDALYLNDYRQIAAVSGADQKILEDSGGSYAGTTTIGLVSQVLYNSTFNSNAYLQNYIAATASGMKVRLMNFTGQDDGWRMWRFVLFNNHSSNVSFSSSKNSASIPNLPSGTKAAMVYGITADQNQTNTYSVSLAGNAGVISASGTNYGVSINDIKKASGQDAGDYVLYNVNETCGITVGAYNSATANSAWYFKGASMYVCPKDIKEPTLLGVAPMTSSTFIKNDKVVVSLVYDEIVASANSVSLSTMLSSSAFTLVGGLGTNVLYFEGTVTNNGCSTPTTSDIIVNNSANIKDLCN